MALQFGECTFDRERRELRRGGSVVHAGPKLLRLLELLVDARPRALTKDEIHTSLWPDTFISDGTLTSLVAELREAIGDEARAPRLVKTIHGYGYVFCGDVTPEARPVAGPAPACRIIVGDREIALPPGEHVLGRSPDAAVFIDDAGISRHHARITVTSTGAILEDLGSKNGTMLNGDRVPGPTPLADGNAIVLGTTALKFRLLRTPGSTETLTVQEAGKNGL